MKNYTKNGKLSFMQYVRSVGSYTGLELISEGIIGIKPMIWPSIPVPDMFRLLKYDPAWSRQMMYGHIDVRVKAGEYDDYEKTLSAIYGEAGVDLPKIEKSDAGSAGSFGATYEIQAPAGQEGDYAQRFIAAIRDVCKKLGMSDVMRCFRPDAAGVKIISDDKTVAAKAYALVDWLRTDSDGQSAAEKMIDVRRTFDSAKTLSKDKQAEARLKAQKLNAEIDSICKKADIAVGDAAERAVSSGVQAGTQSVTVRISGYFNELVLARKILSESDFNAIPRSDLGKYLRPPKVSKKLMLISDVMVRSDDTGFWDDFVKNAEFDYPINENTRGYIKLCDNEFKTQQKQSDWIREFAQGPNPVLVQRYLGFVARVGGETKLKPLTQFKSFAELQAECERLKAVEDADLQRSRREAPVFGSALAARRVKVFRSAEHFGARFFQNRDWTMTWTNTFQQAGVFGRPKPPCVKGHPDQVFEPANFDDWEEGFDPQWRALRDNPGDDFVRDNPIPAFNNPKKSAYARNECEYWCTSFGGPERDGWHGKNAGKPEKRNILIQFMDHRDGLMYQVNDSWFQSENDGENIGILRGLSGSVRARVEQVRRNHRSLDALFIESGFDRLCKNSISNADQSDFDSPDTLRSRCASLGLVTDNNWLIVRDCETLRSLARILDTFSGFVVDTAEPGALFDVSVPLPSVLNVNCENVTDATSLFRNVTARTINLTSTSGIQIMTSMFENATVTTINGLDTSGATETGRMFCNTVHPEGRMVSIPGELDLSNCIDARQMFFNSDVGAARIVNGGKVQHAQDMFVGCSMMRNIPDMMQFRSITSPKRLISNFNGDYSMIFAGCDELIGKTINVEKYMPDQDGQSGGKRRNELTLDQYITAIRDSFEKRSCVKTDSDGFLIIDSPDTVDDLFESFYNYPGIRLAPGLRHAHFLFVEKKLSMKILDVNGCPDISNMFCRCNIARLEQVVGTDRTVDACAMFNECECTAYPRLDFPQATCSAQIFMNAHSPRKLPRLTLGPRFQSDEESISTLDKVDMQAISPPSEANPRGSMIDMPDDLCVPICQYAVGQYANEWISRLGSKRVAQALYLWQYKTKYLEFENTLKRDEDEFILLDDMDAQRAESVYSILRRLHNSVKGLRLTPAAARLPGDKIACFRGLTFERMPVIDLNGLTDASHLFAQSKIGAFAGLTNTKQLENATSMFESAQIGGELPSFDTSGIRNATRMFFGSTVTVRLENFDFSSLESGSEMFHSSNCRISVGADVKLSMPNLTNGSNMFESAQLTCERVTMSLDLPKALDCQLMFSHINGTGPITMDRVDIPACTVCRSMFMGSKQLRRINAFIAPSCTNMNGAFANSEALEFIGAIEAGRVTECESLFMNTPALRVIVSPKIAGNARHGSMFLSSLLAKVYGDANGDMLMARNRALGIIA